MWQEQPGRRRDAVGSWALWLCGLAVYPAGACELHTVLSLVPGDHFVRRLSSKERRAGVRIRGEVQVCPELSNCGRVPGLFGLGFLICKMLAIRVVPPGQGQGDD